MLYTIIRITGYTSIMGRRSILTIYPGKHYNPDKLVGVAFVLFYSRRSGTFNT